MRGKNRYGNFLMKRISPFICLFLCTACTQVPVSQLPSTQTTSVQAFDCKEKNFPTPNPAEEITCRQTQQAYCAFFPNGKPFYCAGKDGKLVHHLNKWGSSLTVSTYDDSGRQTTERYYAYGKMTRGADYDHQAQVLTRFWWDEDGQIRLYRYNFNGRVLDKYYFRAGKQYVRYPDGNDMGETNGPWTLRGNTLVLDGKDFYTLPDNTSPPADTCRLFTPLCETKI